MVMVMAIERFANLTVVIKGCYPTWGKTLSVTGVVPLCRRRS